MPSSARLRRKPGGSGTGVDRLSRKKLRDALATWAPPLACGALFLLLYILGNVDLLDTTRALAINAFLLVGLVLFFPMRYARRLSPRGGLAAALLGVIWLGVVYYPVYSRIYPGERLATADVNADRVPVTLPVAGRGSALDLVIDSHLLPANRGASRVAHYSLIIEADGIPQQSFQGEFKRSWFRQRQDRRESVDLQRERTATSVPLSNPRNGDLRVTAAQVVGHAEDRLTLTLYRRALPPLWVILLLGASLLVAAVVYDRITGAGETAASLAIATGAALTGAYTFPSISSPHPTFRELFGAAIVGALIGGPIGGLVSWLLGARLPVPAYRSRPGGR